MRKAFAAVLLLAAPLALARADVPVRTEQLIYSVIAFNGRDYTPTFAPESSSAVYLMAGADSFISLRKTLVYFWPLTGRLQTDTQTLNEQLDGTLEVRDRRGKVLRSISLQRYTFFNVRGEYEQNWKVAVDADAEKEYQRYLSLYRSFMKSIDDYTRANTEYLAKLKEMSDRIESLKASGKDVRALQEKMSSVPRPRQPDEPADYVVPPAPLQQAFVVNLPPGRYRVRLINPDGSVMEGSDKRIICAAPRRSGSVGYQVIPSDKWTRPEESKTPSAVIYVNGSADLYVSVFYQDELNDLAYQKTLDNAARGNPNVFSWVRIQQVPHASLQMSGADGTASVLQERPFTVQQSQGSSLGYTIIPYDPLGGQKSPDLMAFRVPVSTGTRLIRLSARDNGGKPLPESGRQIRIVSPEVPSLVFALLAIIPLAAMIVVLAMRRRYSRQGTTSRAE